jgi:hypothetical protein
MTNRAALSLLLASCMALSAGCKSQSPEDAVRARWNQLINNTLANDVEAAIEVVDPSEITRLGPDEVKRRQKAFGDLLRAGRITKADLRIDSVTLGADGSTAVVNHSMRTKEGKWLEQVPYGSWVKVDKTWHLKREEGSLRR